MSTGIGDALRDARQAQGRSQQDAAQSLRVRSDYVEALETEQFDVFGADTYARGHLRNYANLLGLDPQPLLDIYDQQVRTDDQTVHHFADAPVVATQRPSIPRWVTALVGFVVVVGAIALIGVLDDRNPVPSDIEVAQTPTTSEASTAPSAPVASTPAVPSSTPSSPAASPSVDGVNVLLVVEADCWIRVTVDDEPQPRTQKRLEAGVTLSIDGDESVQVRYGNAGGVLVDVNGTNYGRPGGNGEVVEITYGPQGPLDASDAQALSGG